MADDYVPRLPATYIDHVAVTSPSRLICLVPKTSDPRDGFHRITFEHFARAVDHLAFHLESKLGDKNSFQTFGFIGHPGDFRYMLLTVAAMKIGWIAFFTSPRNSMVAHLSLLDQANCGTWLIDDEPIPIVAEMANQHPLRFVSIPSEQFFLTNNFDHNSPTYTYNKSFEQGRKEVFAILHTSGSTGIPKVIPQHLSILTAPHAYKAIPRSNFQYKHFKGLKMFSTLPWFHSAAYLTSFGSGIYYEVVIVTPPAAPITAELVDLFHQHPDVDMSMVPPFILQEIVGNPSYLQNCKTVKYIANVGGKSTPEVGQALAKYAHPINIAGATEMGMWPSQLLAPEDYMWWSFDPACGAEFRPLDDKHFEFFIVRDDDYKVYRPIFDTFPHLKEWSSKDIFIKHPTRPNIWQLVGRTDDVIVLSTSEKVNSVTIEVDAGSYPDVKGAIAFGEGRFQLGLLLEVEPESKHKVQNSIGKMLERINKKTVAHGRISEEMVIFSSPEKPFPRAGKGTVQKKLCLELYKDEIDAVYSQYPSSITDVPQQAVHYDFERIATYLEKWISSEVGFDAPARERDIFQAGIGMDSLHVLRLAQTLNKTAKHLSISTQDIYRNPTISKLTAQILLLQASSTEIEWNGNDHVESILKKYSKNLPINTRPSMHSDSSSLTVAVTGTTGSLGAYLIKSLLKQKGRIGKIYRLDRRPQPNASQASEEGERAQVVVEHMQIAICKPRLGLNVQMYTKLAQEIDIIIHNAWDVDFNKAVDSFEPHIHGVRRLVDLCAHSRKCASLHFMSTISTVLNWRPKDVEVSSHEDESVNAQQAAASFKIPEKLYEDQTVSLRMGYAKSKHVSERILAKACEESDIPVSIHRIGQIAGPISDSTFGIWQKHEWVPTMIQTSIALNAFPGDIGPLNDIDWIPIDILGDVLVELALTKRTSSTTNRGSPDIFHSVNPHMVSWSTLLPTVLENLPPGTSPTVLPLHDWVEKVKEAAESLVKTSDDLHELPAIKILRFFDRLGQLSSDQRVHLDLEKTCSESKILSELDAVKPEWMQMWMQQWNFGGDAAKPIVNGARS